MIHVGDCLEILRTLPDSSVDSVVTDPPYGLSREPDMAEVLRHWLAGDDYVHRGRGFMGKAWDSFVPGPAVWRECLRVLKPGGHLLAFFGTRTQDMGKLAIRLAGFEIRDSIAWVYGSGFPKSLDVSKAIDVAAGESREVAGRHTVHESAVAIAGPSGRCLTCGKGRGGQPGNCQCDKHGAPVTEAAIKWQGWGTALKPALEPITVARKRLSGTVAANVLAHGTGALNIDGCRIVGESTLRERPAGSFGRMNDDGWQPKPGENGSDLGRWPANLIHDGSRQVLALFPDSNGGGPPRTLRRGERGDECWGMGDMPGDLRDGGSGSAARFFYCAKASREDRNAGLGDPGPQFQMGARPCDYADVESAARGNHHPTVKPTELMRWLCRLVTPPGGLVLDPFAGSGSTGRAALAEGFEFIGIELDPDYAEIARRRIAATQPGLGL